MVPATKPSRPHRRVARLAQGLLWSLDNVRREIKANRDKIARDPDDTFAVERCAFNIAALKKRYQLALSCLKEEPRLALPGGIGGTGEAVARPVAAPRAISPRAAGISLVAVPGGYLGKRITRRAA